jgi:hypothetical protein
MLCVSGDNRQDDRPDHAMLSPRFQTRFATVVVTQVAMIASPFSPPACGRVDDRPTCCSESGGCCCAKRSGIYGICRCKGEDAESVPPSAPRHTEDVGKMPICLIAPVNSELANSLRRFAHRNVSESWAPRERSIQPLLCTWRI